MQLTIHNLTDTVLISHIFAAGEHVLFPNHPTTVKLPKGSENLNLSSCKDILASCDGKWTLPVDQLSVRVKLAFGSSWQEIKVPKDCPLRLYRVRSTRSHHSLLILPERDADSYLASLPDTVSLSALTLPGTHDTYAESLDERFRALA